jgi:RNA recognition motif-containing protein
MAKNIYVGNLPWKMTEEELQEMFQAHGSVRRVQVIKDKESGRSRGFGFVEMDNDAEAQQAIDALNGADCQGRPLTVNEAKPREERAPSNRATNSNRGGASGGGYGGSSFRGGYAGGTNRGRHY